MWAAENAKSTYMEIGSGNSTMFAKAAILASGKNTRIVSIDPFPRTDIDTLCDDVKREPLEDLDISYFNQLVPGDTLFVDISHRSFMNSDVTTIMLDVLPTSLFATGCNPKKTVRDAIGEIIAAWLAGTLKNEPHFHNLEWMSKEVLT